MTLDAIVGPEPGKICAALVRRVLSLARDEGHPDPRHAEHWWEWADWPLDGRQWEHEGQLNRSFLDKKLVREHERRVALGGIRGSELRVERKLEGAFWGEERFPGGRTAVRSSGTFPVELFRCLDEEDNKKARADDKARSGRSTCGLDDIPEESAVGDGEEDGSEEGEGVSWYNLVIEACHLRKRSLYDASIKPDKIRPLPKDEKFEQDFEDAKPFDGHFTGLQWGEYFCNEDCDEVNLMGATYYTCTDSFATKGEQQSAEELGTPSISVCAYVHYMDSSMKFRTAFVVAEAPMRTFGCAERLDDRIAGFVFRDVLGEEEKEPEAVHVTYVEACNNDLQTLNEDAKDALLEDRALIVHKLLRSVVGDVAKGYPVEVSNPHHLPRVKPEAYGLPPVRTLTTMMTVHRADPRWPLTKPNSVCLECGSGEKLMQCSKCGVRMFCSSECMAKSWKSDVWSHKVECKRLCDQQKSQVGRSGNSLREGLRELVETGIIPAALAQRQMNVLERSIGQVALDEKYESVDEMREKQRESAREARKSRKKGKGKKIGKRKN